MMWPATPLFKRCVCSCAQRSLFLGGQFRKAPLSLDLCIILVSFLLQPSQSTLLSLQIASFIMVCFSGFLRYDCACQIVADEARFYSSHMEIFSAKRKNDQFRSGSVVFTAQVKSLSCPVSLLESLLVKAGSLGKHVPVFRSFKKGSSEKFCPAKFCPAPKSFAPKSFAPKVLPSERNRTYGSSVKHLNSGSWSVA